MPPFCRSVASGGEAAGCSEAAGDGDRKGLHAGTCAVRARSTKLLLCRIADSVFVDGFFGINGDEGDVCNLPAVSWEEGWTAPAGHASLRSLESISIVSDLQRPLQGVELPWRIPGFEIEKEAVIVAARRG